MEKLLVESIQNGGGSAIVGLCVLFAINVVVNVGKFLWSIKQQKEKISEDTLQKVIQGLALNTNATERNSSQIAGLEKAFTEIPKLKLDLRRAFSALRMTAGDRWPEIRKDIMADDGF